MSDTTGLRNWCWTTYKLPVDMKCVLDDKNHRYTVYQIEKCPKTQKLHAQGYTEFIRTMRMKKVKSLFQDDTMHLEPRQGTAKQAKEYCMKEESRVEPPKEFGESKDERGKRTDLISAKKKILGKRRIADLYQDDDLIDVMAKYPKWAEKVLKTKPTNHHVEIELFDWQIRILELLKGPPEKRRIIWIWSSASGTGKTTFYDYCSTKFEVLPGDGKLQDIIYAYDEHDIIWFDYTRAQQGYESYNALERLSNHSFQLSTKYESIKKFIKCHIVVTSNHPPDESKLPHRFHVVNVDPDTTPNDPHSLIGATIDDDDRREEEEEERARGSEQ